MLQTSICAMAGVLFRTNYGTVTVSVPHQTEQTRVSGESLVISMMMSPLPKGMLEVAAGLAYMAGPPVGGALYQVGQRGAQ